MSVTAKVRINLGLFHITISFSFDMTVSEQVVIGTNEKAPWDSAPAMIMATAARLNPGRRAVRSRAAALRPRMKSSRPRGGDYAVGSQTTGVPAVHGARSRRGNEIR